MTSNFHELIRRFREVNEYLAYHAINNASPLHDDNLDGIVNICIHTNTMQELRIVLSVLDGLPNIIDAGVHVSAAEAVKLLELATRGKQE
jgi:hypothetical protein